MCIWLTLGFPGPDPLQVIETRRVLLTATIWSRTLASKSNLVVLGLLKPPIGERPLGVKSSPRPWPPTASSGCHLAHRMACELEGRV